MDNINDELDVSSYSTVEVPDATNNSIATYSNDLECYNTGGGSGCNLICYSDSVLPTVSQYPSDSTSTIINPTKVGYIFTAKVIKEIIKNGVICTEHNVKSPAGNYVVPYDILASKYSVPYFYPGHTGSIASASEVYNELVRMTRWLLKVGTYSYNEKRETDDGYDNEWSSNGAAIFSDSYAISQIGNLSTAPLTPIPSNGGVVNTSMITIDSINNIAANCLASWSSSNRPNYVKSHVYCHDSCHSKCHHPCNCYCHKNGWGYSNGDLSWNCNSNPTIDW